MRIFPIEYLLLWYIVFINSADCQICNSKDKLSGGLFLPAFSSGGAMPFYENASLYNKAFCEFKNGTPDKNCKSPTSDPQGMAILYLLLLLWTFMGVGLFADVFMGSIEVITSVKKYVEVIENNCPKQVEVYVWNATVANLTLMALGSSAPEILLSVIELLGGKFFSGELGPSTIVGSAAFNLYIILAVCVVAIPKKYGSEPGFRKIVETEVFYMTAFSSVFAYLWLLIILKGTSPNVVDIPEALITLSFFPILVTICYLLDSGKCICIKKKKEIDSDEGHITGIRLSTISNGERKGSTCGSLIRFQDIHEVNDMLKGYQVKGKNADYLAAVVMAKKFKETRVSRATYRVNANRLLTGGKPIIPKMPDLSELQEIEVNVPNNEDVLIYFDAIKYNVNESSGFIDLRVNCKRENKDTEAKLDNIFTVDYETGDPSDTATPDEDYESAKGTLTFSAGTTSQKINIKIVDDDEDENDEIFTVKLLNASGNAKLVESMKEAKVTIIDNDSPGVIEFAKHEVPEEKKISTCYRVFENCGSVAIKIVRKNGSQGTVSVKYATENGQINAAMAGSDYEAQEGTLVFNTGETEKIILVPIIDDEDFEKNEEFFVKLSSPENCKLGSLIVCKVVIMNDDEVSKLGDQVFKLLNMNRDKHRLGSNDWKQQFIEAVEAPPEGPHCVSTVLHYLNVPWKLFAAMIPPTSFFNGWLCFGVSLVFIGITTALIGDIASLFGCSIGLRDSVTAITVVALGTSLPDTFASKTAAVGEATADNSIGNVTGSNSVNVFLGLGLPWTIASIYWATQNKNDDEFWKVWREKVGHDYQKGSFVVDAGDLGFSVMIFCIFAVMTLGIITLRGKVLEGELGGKYTWPTAALFVLFWILYITLSICKAYGSI